MEIILFPCGKERRGRDIAGVLSSGSDIAPNFLDDLVLGSLAVAVNLDLEITPSGEAEDPVLLVHGIIDKNLRGERDRGDRDERRVRRHIHTGDSDRILDGRNPKFGSVDDKHDILSGLQHKADQRILGSIVNTLPSSCGEQFDLTVSTEIILFQTRRESTRRGSVERLATRITVSQIDDSQRLAGEIEAGLGRSPHLGTYNKGLRRA